MDCGAREIHWTGREQWVEVNMEEEPLLGKQQRQGKYRKKGVQDIGYPHIPKGDHNNGSKTKRRKRNRGWWRRLRGVIRAGTTIQETNPDRSLEDCREPMERLTLEEHVEAKANTTYDITTSNRNMDKWTTWRAPK
uniref:Rev protein n=1 Tax=Caprine arthritis encephalitis virus TaxID=11660 RepID=F6LY21_CAEV|nr:rev protein [Caprine arthritis encephalitis virus]